MRHFHPPIHAAIVAVTVVAGLASYQGVDKLVLAKGGATYGTTSEPGHEPVSSTTSTTPHTSTTEHHETGSTTSTTIHHETGSTTSTTVHHEPTASSTSTTIHTRPSTTTTVHHEPTPTTTAPKSPPASQTQLSLNCISGFTGGQGAAKCSWSQSNAPNFGHYRLTRELVGTPRQTIFESNDRGTWYYVDFPLQAGSQYSYIIEAYDTAGNLIAHGGPFHLTCCGGGGTA